MSMRPSTGLNDHAVECGLGDLAFLFQGLNTMLKIGVEFGNPLLDRSIEAFQSVVAVRNFGLEHLAALLGCLIFRTLPLEQGSQDFGQAVIGEQVLLHVRDNQSVQLGHRYVPASTDRLALLMPAATTVVAIVPPAATSTGAGHSGAAGGTDRQPRQ